MGRYVTLELTVEEERAIDELAATQDLSYQAVLRQALRLYQMTQRRLATGETMHFSGDGQRIRDFAGPNALGDGS